MIALSDLRSDTNTQTPTIAKAHASSYIGAMRHSLASFVIPVAAALLTAGSAMAQYDRDGRYVPSPNGIPSDPAARPIPMDPGTPGAAIGTPSLPRSQMAPPHALPAPTTAVPIQPGSTNLKRFRAPPQENKINCASRWSRSTGITERNFNRMCSQPTR